MAAPIIVEEEAWKCLKHPSNRERNGVCPVCLKERLAILSRDCAAVRPCAYLAATTSSSSSASSSFGGGEIGCEPDFRRSKSVGVTILRPRDGLSGSFRRNPPPNCQSKAAWFRSLFKYSSKSARKSEVKEEKQSEVKFVSARCSGAGDRGIVDFAVLMRSRSVSVEVTSGCGVGDFTKAKGWHFRSPVKAFRQPKVVQERSPFKR
ncbi:PREDICTED: uncharacterized protein LOC109177147 [Ipomoea nil]|uniref:uncharacterized protein LOC109177147 n=1 Tax=Ipomoea nil TaxID=35883 RepID=UPI0009011A54|nr:PREDICTED: uncharacterized protein LOC109177147 [Ipomoea nil]